MKPGQRILLLNPPTNFIEGLGDLPEGMRLDSIPEGEYDGLLWISYPKGSSKVKTDLSRDNLWEKMADTNWRPVTLVSVDETWSAMRFRPSAVVGK